MTISFTGVPDDLLVPGSYTEYDSSRANSGLTPLPNRVLLIGSRTSAGTVPALELRMITRKEQGIEYFGRNSQLSRMVQKFKDANKNTEVWAIAMDDDGAGVAQQRTITITGPATGPGVIAYLIAGQRVPVAVETGDTATTMATNSADAIDDNLDLPVTAASALGVVTTTAVHEAAFTSDIDIRHNYYNGEVLPPGVTVTHAQTVAGATNPDVADVLAVLPQSDIGRWFTTIISGYSDDANMDAIETYMIELWGPLVQRDSMTVTAFRGAYSAATAYGSGRNSPFSTVMTAGLSPNPGYEWAAVYGAVETSEPDPARGRQTLRLPGILPQASNLAYSIQEQNILLNGGMSTHSVDAAGNVYIQRSVTTYQENALSIPDRTYLNVTTLRTLSALRYTLNARIQLKYPRHKLADDGTLYGPGQPVVTPKVMRGEHLAIFRQWEDKAWVENFKQFKEELVVERNGTDRDRLDSQLVTDLINQLIVSANKLQFIV